MTPPAERPSDGPLPGRSFHDRDAVGSTNDEARALGRDGAPDGTIVRARRQTAGRGRAGRSWDSPEGNLYLSLLLRPDRPHRELAALSLVAGLAAAEAAGGLAARPDTIRLKWPNDVLADGRKLAGVLIETDATPGHASPFAVIGVGLNVASAPDGPSPAATCLADLAPARPPSVDDATRALVAALDRWTTLWRAEGAAPVRAAWLERAHGLGAPVVLRIGGAERAGRFAGLDAAGGLILEDGEGRTAFAVGEAVFGTAAP